MESHLAASLGEFPPKSAKFGKEKQSEALDSVSLPSSTLDCESDPNKHALLIQFKPPEACQFAFVPRKHVNIPITRTIGEMSAETLGGAVRGGQIFLDLLKQGPCGSQQSIFGLSYLVKKNYHPRYDYHRRVMCV